VRLNATKFEFVIDLKSAATSQPRSLLSIARLNMARSRVRPSTISLGAHAPGKNRAGQTAADNSDIGSLLHSDL
jgi:hypothetical protein